MIIIGKQFAYRKRRKVGDPVEPVLVVKEGPPKSNKVRIRHLDGEYVDFEEWVPKSRLILPWEEASAFCEDERRLLIAKNASSDVQDSVNYDAAENVFGAISQLFDEDLVCFGWKAIERNITIIMQFEATVNKLKLDKQDLLAEPYSFIDRFGDYKAPLSIGEKLAQQFCKRFPKVILKYISDRENKLLQEIRQASNQREQDFYEGWLQREKPALTLAREWCGDEELLEFNEVQELKNEIWRLRALIEKNADFLKSSGHPHKASQLLKELQTILIQ